MRMRSLRSLLSDVFKHGFNSVICWSAGLFLAESPGKHFAVVILLASILENDV